MDRGDSLLALVPAEQAGLGPFLGFLLHLERLVVDRADADKRMRLRLAASLGVLTVSENGWLGAALSTVSRLLDADLLRRMADADDAVLTVAITEEIFDGPRALKPRGFRHELVRVTAVTKDDEISAWFYTVDAGV